MRLGIVIEKSQLFGELLISMMIFFDLGQTLVFHCMLWDFVCGSCLKHQVSSLIMSKWVERLAAVAFVRQLTFWGHLRRNFAHSKSSMEIFLALSQSKFSSSAIIHVLNRLSNLTTIRRFNVCTHFSWSFSIYIKI